MFSKAKYICIFLIVLFLFPNILKASDLNSLFSVCQQIKTKMLHSFKGAINTQPVQAKSKSGDPSILNFDELIEAYEITTAIVRNKIKTLIIDGVEYAKGTDYINNLFNPDNTEPRFLVWELIDSRGNKYILKVLSREDLIVFEANNLRLNLRESKYENRVVSFRKLTEGAYFLLLRAVPGEVFTEEKFSLNLNSNDDREFLEAVVKGIILEIAFLHSRGIVHHDIKNENIVVDYRTINGVKRVLRSVSIIDFQISTKVDLNSASQQDLLYGSIGSTIGTIGFIPPECFEGNKYRGSFPKDWYALGRVLENIIVEASSVQSITWTPQNSFLKELQDALLQKDPKTRMEWFEAWKSKYN